MYVGHSATVRSRSGGDVSDVPRNFLYKSTTNTYPDFLDFFYFSVFNILKKKKNLKYENYCFKNIGMHSLHRNKQNISYKIVRKIDIKNATRFLKLIFINY